MKNNASYGYTNLTLAVLVWGAQGSMFSVLLTGGFSSSTISSSRVITAVILYGIIFLCKGKPLTPVKGKDILLFLGMGTFGLYGMYITYTSAVGYLGVPLAATINYLAPTLVLIFSFIIFKERITFNKAISVVVVLLGCAIATGAYNSTFSVSRIGLILALSSAVCYALFSLCLREALKRYSSMEASFYAAVGGLPMSLIGLLQAPLPAISLPLGTLFVLQAFLAPFAYIFYGIGMRICGASTSSIFATLELPLSAMLSFIFLHESLPVYKIIGVLLVLFATIFGCIEKPGSMGRSEK